MPIVTCAERHGFEKGEEQGLQQGRREGLFQGIALAIKLKFGTAVAASLLPELGQHTDVAVLEKLLQAIETAATIDELRGLLT